MANDVETLRTDSEEPFSSCFPPNMSQQGIPSMSSAPFQSGAPNPSPMSASMDGPLRAGPAPQNSNRYYEAVVQGHMTGPPTSSEMLPQSSAVNPEIPLFPGDQKPSYPVDNAYPAGPVQNQSTNPFSPPGSPPRTQRQQSPPPNASGMQMTSNQQYIPTTFIPPTSPPGGHHGGQTFITGSESGYPLPPGSQPPARLYGQDTSTGTSTFGGQYPVPPPQSPPESLGRFPNNSLGNSQQYNPHQYDQHGYNNNTWPGTARQSNYYGNQGWGPDFGQFPQSQPQPQPQPSVQPIVVMHQHQVCAPGTHAFRTRYGVAGIIIAILCFPIGLFALCLDSEEICVRCGQRL